MRSRTFLLASLALLVCSLAACEARYESLTPPGAVADAGGGRPDAAPGDASAADVGVALDQGVLEVLATGALTGRSGYAATGMVSLVRLGDGALSLRFSEDFSAPGVPSPVVLLTTRGVVTGGVQPALGDISLGPMASVLGAQAYDAPAAGAGALYAFVYCLPFTVEVARATLEPAP